MKTEYADLSEAELASMIETAQRALKERQDFKRKDMIHQIKEMAASVGLEVDIREASKPAGRKGSKVPVKYQNPNNLSQKWTGRGMRPKWLASLLEQGHSIQDFEVHS